MLIGYRENRRQCLSTIYPNTQGSLQQQSGEKKGQPLGQRGVRSSQEGTKNPEVWLKGEQVCS